MLLNILQAMFGFLAGAIGIAGNTWDSAKPTFLQRITARGWCALALASCTFVVTVIKEVVSDKEATERNANVDQLQTKLLIALERQASQATGTPQASEAATRLADELRANSSAPEPRSAAVAPPPAVGDQPVWLALARKEVGVRETGMEPGNPRILAYLGSTVLAGAQLSETIPWAAAFINWTLQESGISTPNSANIAAWEQWGTKTPEPRVGCIAIIHLPSRVRQIGFVVAYDYSKVTLIAGNVQNEVQYREYPRKEITMYRCANGA